MLKKKLWINGKVLSIYELVCAEYSTEYIKQK